MKIKLTNEEQILDPSFRKHVIMEIESTENVARKYEIKKRYDIMKDLVRPYVIERLSKEMEQETVAEMIHRAGNISFGKKIVDKKARVYKDSPVRTSDIDNQDAVDAYEKLTKINTQMKKTNRNVEAYKNTSLIIQPHQNFGSDKFEIKLRPMVPHTYDVIESASDPEEPAVYILSYYADERHGRDYLAGKGYRTADYGMFNGTTGEYEFRQGNNFDETIADSPNDKGEEDGKQVKYYIWWTKNVFWLT